MRKFLLLFIVLVGLPVSAFAYALLSHEAIIDATWEASVRPALLQKFPQTTEEALEKARAYVYGGSLIPDIGYSPFGSRFFSDLVHYVRNGEFIGHLLEEAQDVNEYAFALGVLCHYVADVYGHSMSTNKAVPLLFPKAKKEFGDVVTYEQCKAYHSRVEFSFDVIQSAKGAYAPEDYHDFIGFKISEPVLERAFLKAYGLELKDVFRSVSVATATFRFAVRSMFPALTKSAWMARKANLIRTNPKMKKKNYVYRMRGKDYRNEFGRPSLPTLAMSAVIFVLPKVGPFSGLNFKVPNAAVEKLFEESFQSIITQYSTQVKKIKNGALQLDNLDLDTGEKTIPGEYQLADHTHCKLLLKLHRKDFERCTPFLAQYLANFYARPEAILMPKPNKQAKWKKINRALEALPAHGTH